MVNQTAAAATTKGKQFKHHEGLRELSYGTRSATLPSLSFYKKGEGGGDAACLLRTKIKAS